MKEYRLPALVFSDIVQLLGSYPLQRLEEAVLAIESEKVAIAFSGAGGEEDAIESAVRTKMVEESRNNSCYRMRLTFGLDS